MFSRRRLLTGGLGAVAAWSLPKGALAAPHVARRCHQRFEAAVANTPALDPWRSIDVERLAPTRARLEGRIPRGLRGTLYRNGPAGFERAGARYQHWFDGDGMVQAFRLDDRGVTHFGRKVRTEKWAREEQAGRFLFRGAGSRVPDPEPARANDTANPANIAVVPWGGELLALWEAGSPYALDPDTLSTERRITWSSETDRMPFSAHPLFDRAGRMWNFGLAQWAGKTGVLALYQLSPERGLERTTLVPLPFPGYMHSFAMTERWLVFYLSPHVLERAREGTYVEAHAWRPELGGRFLLVDKEDFDRREVIDAPPGFVFHFADAHDLPGGGIALRACWSERPKAMDEDMFGVMCGERTSLDDGAHLVRFELAGGRAAKTSGGPVGDFPVVDPRSRSPFVVLTADRELALIDPKGRPRTLRADGEVLLEEHRFVPRSARPGDGWLVGTGYDLEARASVLTVFDTASASTTPVLQATLDRRIPFGFHGWFLRA